MSGNGSGYSNFTPGPDNVLPNPSVKGTEAGCDQFDMISRAVGGKKMRKSAKMLKGGSSCSGKPNNTAIQSTIMGGSSCSGKPNNTAIQSTIMGGSSCSGKPNNTAIQSTMMGGKKSKKSMKKSKKSIRKMMKKSRKTMKK
jgi:hypothetical protein